MPVHNGLCMALFLILIERCINVWCSSETLIWWNPGTVIFEEYCIVDKPCGYYMCFNVCAQHYQ